MAGDKYIYNNGGTLTEKAAIQTSAGAGDAGKIPALDANGKLAANMMPSGFGADISSIQASENLAANDLVNIHNVSGSARVRKADASAAGKEAHGFVLAAVTSGNNGDVYFEGSNAGLSGLTPGPLFLSTTPGQATSTAPSGAGQVVQRVGVAVSATALNFEAAQPIVLA
ncbi:hypothetical protein [Nocardia gipuzkoensis]|uniref:hypothetical protein n=1 Tax=Nocardia gipuzkoensis TaxID=2749991 RepID=UPI00237DD135|nr:hypothetical protein [Nocardia gipuzkoensis]MDE1673860.1 hypothetical protein [Nocardia gipuzkoensis]